LTIYYFIIIIISFLCFCLFNFFFRWRSRFFLFFYFNRLRKNLSLFYFIKRFLRLLNFYFLLFIWLILINFYFLWFLFFRLASIFYSLFFLRMFLSIFNYICPSLLQILLMYSYMNFSIWIFLLILRFYCSLKMTGNNLKIEIKHF